MRNIAAYLTLAAVLLLGVSLVVRPEDWRRFQRRTGFSWPVPSWEGKSDAQYRLRGLVPLSFVGIVVVLSMVRVATGR